MGAQEPLIRREEKFRAVNLGGKKAGLRVVSIRTGAGRKKHTSENKLQG